MLKYNTIETLKVSEPKISVHQIHIPSYQLIKNKIPNKYILCKLPSLNVRIKVINTSHGNYLVSMLGLK